MQHQLRLLKKLEVEINADCIKVCPHNKNLFSLGHYSQIEGENVIGAISLLTVIPEGEPIWDLQTIKTGPILHLVWLGMLWEEQYILVAACRDSCVRIYSYDPLSKVLKEIKRILVEG